MPDKFFTTSTGQLLRTASTGAIITAGLFAEPPGGETDELETGVMLSSFDRSLRLGRTISFALAQDNLVGTFWDGSHWAVPTQSQLSVTNTLPASIRISGDYSNPPNGNAYAQSFANSRVNGAMINFTGVGETKLSIRQGFDERAKDYSSANILYTESVNDAPELTGSAILQPGDVFWKAYSGEIDDTVSGRTPIWSYATIKVLSAPPPVGSFRPSMYSADQVFHRIEDMDWTGWRNVPVPAGTFSNTPAEVAERMKHIYPLQYFSVHSESVRPINDWGAYWAYGAAELLCDAMIYLHCNIDQAIKEEIRKGIVQFGLDMYWRVIAEPGGPANIGDDSAASINGAGHDIIRTIPMLIAGMVLGDQAIVDAFKALHPQFGDNERAQCFWVGDPEINNPRDSQSSGRPTEPYTEISVSDTDRGRPEWRQYAKLSHQEHIATSSYDCVYREVCAYALIVSACCLRMADYDDVHGHGAYFAYADFYDATYRAGPSAMYLRQGSVYYSGWENFVGDNRFNVGDNGVGSFYDDMVTATAGNGSVNVDLVGVPFGNGVPITAVEYRIAGQVMTLKSQQSRYTIPGFWPTNVGTLNGPHIDQPVGQPRYQANVSASDGAARLMQDYRFQPTVKGGTQHTVSAPSGTTQIEVRAKQGVIAGPWKTYLLDTPVT